MLIKIINEIGLRDLGIREGRKCWCLGRLHLNDIVSISVESCSLVGL